MIVMIIVGCLRDRVRGAARDDCYRNCAKGEEAFHDECVKCIPRADPPKFQPLYVTRSMLRDDPKERSLREERTAERARARKHEVDQLRSTCCRLNTARKKTDHVNVDAQIGDDAKQQAQRERSRSRVGVGAMSLAS